MKLILLFKNLIHGLYNALRRFPLAITASSITAVLFILINHNHNNLTMGTINDLKRYAMIFALSIPVSLCIYLLFEKKSISSIKIKLLCFIMQLALLILYLVFFLKDFQMVSMSRYFSITAALYLAFIYISHLYSRNGFELYVVKLLSRFFTTVLYSFILFLGICAILFTIKQLLLINITEKLYYDIALLISGIFVPAFFLAGIPLIHQQMEEEDYPKLLKILLLYIIIPLLSIYTIILYIYFGKVIFTQQWQIQLVMHLVLWYSITSVAVIFLVSILKTTNKWLGRFISIYTKTIFPLLVMLFIAIGKRVSIYGITESRYFVILLSLWVLGVMLYLNLSKKKLNIIIPLSLSTILVLAVIGPWSCYSISKLTQNNRFNSILVKNQMLVDNKVIKSSTTLSESDKIELSNIIAYFNRYHEINNIEALPKNFATTDMERVFGFAYYENPYKYNPNKYFYYNLASTGSPININGYDYLIDLREKRISNGNAESNIDYSYEDITSTIKISKDNSLLYEQNLSKFVEKLFKKYGYENTTIINNEEMNFIDENSKIKVKFVFLNINGFQESNSGKIRLDYTNFYLLIKMK